MKTFPLEPIEKASIDELRALQLGRLRWSLKHAYDNVEHYRRKFDAAGASITARLSASKLSAWRKTKTSATRRGGPQTKLCAARGRPATLCVMPPEMQAKKPAKFLTMPRPITTALRSFMTPARK